MVGAWLGLVAGRVQGLVTMCEDREAGAVACLRCRLELVVLVLWLVVESQVNACLFEVASEGRYDDVHVNEMWSPAKRQKSADRGFCVGYGLGCIKIPWN